MLSFPTGQNNMSDLQQVASGISRAVNTSASIITYTVTAIKSTTLDVWSQDILETLRNWPKPRSIGILFDLSEHGVGIPYLSLTRGNIFNVAILRTKEASLIEIMNTHPGFRVWFALVLSDSSLGTYMVSKGKTPTSGLERVRHKVFFSVAAGLNWLTESIQSNESSDANDFGSDARV